MEYEFEGKTTEEALENASRELDLPQEELNFDIIEGFCKCIHDFYSTPESLLVVATDPGCLY